MIQRSQVRQIADLHAKQMEVMIAIRQHCDAESADGRHGAIAIRMLEEMLRSARRARDELAALDGPSKMPLDRPSTSQLT